MIRTRLEAPIVLAHGLFGFDRIGVGPVSLIDYFRGIPGALRAAGNMVVVPRVHPTAGMPRRVEQLARGISAAIPEGPFHLIGHSLGGLDARLLLDAPEWRSRVLSLTTIGTPHLGSSLADIWSIRLGRASRFLEALGLDVTGLTAVTRTWARRFHRKHPLPPGVRCACLAGDPPARWTCWPMMPFRYELAAHEGANDGFVPVESALAFGEPLGTQPIDHLRQMNWFPQLRDRRERPDPLDLYESAVARLAQFGYGATPPEAEFGITPSPLRKRFARL
ncbi:MAG: hypothetical protein U0800_11130 [Isosphaeraceae bacterium]